MEESYVNFLSINQKVSCSVKSLLSQDQYLWTIIDTTEWYHAECYYFFVIRLQDQGFINGVMCFLQCPLQKMPPVSDVVDVLPKVQAMSLADRAMFDRSMRAFVSYVQAYAKHECSLIFRVKGENSQPQCCMYKV